jgi:hypothetical protein
MIDVLFVAASSGQGVKVGAIRDWGLGFVLYWLLSGRISPYKVRVA